MATNISTLTLPQSGTPPNLAVTIITVRETFNGWVVKINDRSESD